MPLRFPSGRRPPVVRVMAGMTDDGRGATLRRGAWFACLACVGSRAAADIRCSRDHDGIRRRIAERRLATGFGCGGRNAGIHRAALDTFFGVMWFSVCWPGRRLRLGDKRNTVQLATRLFGSKACVWWKRDGWRHSESPQGKNSCPYLPKANFNVAWGVSREWVVTTHLAIAWYRNTFLWLAEGQPQPIVSLLNGPFWRQFVDARQPIVVRQSGRQSYAPV